MADPELPELLAGLEKWLRGLAPSQRLERLARAEAVLRASDKSADRQYVLVIVEWRLRQQKAVAGQCGRRR
jgi:hypothetical protein